MKKNELVKICSWLKAQHMKRTLADDSGKISVFYPRKHFGDSIDIQAVRKRFNVIHSDLHCKQIIEHDALVIYDTVPLDRGIL